jgi:hypothetical protein
MRKPLSPHVDPAVTRRRARWRSARLVALFLATVAASCSSAPSRADRGITAAPEEIATPRRDQPVEHEQRPISDTHPYQINDYLIYPVKWTKVEDLAPTVQELFQARYGPGVVVIPHVPTNKLLIYLPPPQERQRAGAAATGAGAVGAGVRAPVTTGARGTAARGSAARGRTTRGIGAP